MAADGKTPPTHPQGGGGNIMCTCSIFVCRHKNNDMSTLLGHVHTYIPTDRQTDTQAYIHKSIQTYSYTYTWLHMCDVSPLWGGGWGGTRGGWIIYIYIHVIHGTHIHIMVIVQAGYSSYAWILWLTLEVHSCQFLRAIPWPMGFLRPWLLDSWHSLVFCLWKALTHTISVDISTQHPGTSTYR